MDALQLGPAYSLALKYPHLETAVCRCLLFYTDDDAGGGDSSSAGDAAASQPQRPPCIQRLWDELPDYLRAELCEASAGSYWVRAWRRALMGAAYVWASEGCRLAACPPTVQCAFGEAAGALHDMALLWRPHLAGQVLDDHPVPALPAACAPACMQVVLCAWKPDVPAAFDPADPQEGVERVIGEVSGI